MGSEEGEEEEGLEVDEEGARRGVGVRLVVDADLEEADAGEDVVRPGDAAGAGTRCAAGRGVFCLSFTPSSPRDEAEWGFFPLVARSFLLACTSISPFTRGAKSGRGRDDCGCSREKGVCCSLRPLRRRTPLDFPVLAVVASIPVLAAVDPSR